MQPFARLIVRALRADINDASTHNVPKSLTNEGNTVLGNQRVNDTDWMITVKKK